MQTEFNSTQYEVYPDGIHRHFWMQARHNIIARRLQKIGQVGRILDIGCGRGVTVSAMWKKGFDVYGCELGTPAPYCSEIKSRLFLGSDFRDLAEDFRSSVNVVLLLDVIEHLEDPTEFLKNIRSSFPNLSYVIATVPARQELWTNYDDFYGHLIRYSEDSFRSLLDSVNFKATELRYIFQGLYLPMWVQAKLLKKRNLHNHSSGEFSKFHDVLSGVFDLEDRFLWGKVPGTSIFSLIDFKTESK